MAVYLVDYENVYIDGLDGLEELSEQDEVAIFYTQNRCGLTFDLHKRLVACKASLRLMEVCIETSRKNAAKNALDLQLSMYIGYLLGSREQLELYIISKDHDFDLDLSFFTQYLQDRAFCLQLYPTIAHAKQGLKEEELELPAEETKSTEEQTIAPKAGTLYPYPVQMLDKVSEILENITDPKQYDRICSTVAAADNLLSLNNLLSRDYRDGRQVKEIYHALKPYFNVLRSILQEDTIYYR